MRDMKIRKMVLAALMAALTYVATMVVRIPSPMQGYVNLGDCCVLLSGWILGPWWGDAAVYSRAQHDQIVRCRLVRTGGTYADPDGGCEHRGQDQAQTDEHDPPQPFHPARKTAAQRVHGAEG